MEPFNRRSKGKGQKDNKAPVLGKRRAPGRNRVTLQTDGQVRTGRDVVIAAMLGAEATGDGGEALTRESLLFLL